MDILKAIIEKRFTTYIFNSTIIYTELFTRWITIFKYIIGALWFIFTNPKLIYNVCIIFRNTWKKAAEREELDRIRKMQLPARRKFEKVGIQIRHLYKYGGPGPTFGSWFGTQPTSEELYGNMPAKPFDQIPYRRDTGIEPTSEELYGTILISESVSSSSSLLLETELDSKELY